MHGEIMYPNHKDGDVDGEDAEHEDKDGVGVVVEIIMDPGTLSKSETLHRLHADGKEKPTTVSRANLNARVQVASCTMQASKYAN